MTHSRCTQPHPSRYGRLHPHCVCGEAWPCARALAEQAGHAGCSHRLRMLGGAS